MLALSLVRGRNSLNNKYTLGGAKILIFFRAVPAACAPLYTQAWTKSQEK
jgi:hypothetical protein